MELKERDIAGLEAKLDQLEQVKDRQAGQIETLRQSRLELDEKSGEASTTIRHLTDEINKLKYTLDDVTRRQKQVRTFQLHLLTLVDLFLMFCSSPVDVLSLSVFVFIVFIFVFL